MEEMVDVLLDNALVYLPKLAAGSNCKENDIDKVNAYTESLVVSRNKARSPLIKRFMGGSESESTDLKTFVREFEDTDKAELLTTKGLRAYIRSIAQAVNIN